MSSVRTVLKQIVPRLSVTSDTPELDARVLLANIMEQPRSLVEAYPDKVLNRSQLAAVRKAVTRLEDGEPFPYVIGHWEFFGLDFEITPDVLIPRPETELMVERAIRWLSESPKRRTVADVGTGSGCIAVSVAKHVSKVKIIATDLSLPSLKVARRNACKHNVLRSIDFIQCDLLPPHPDPLPTNLHFDLVCANLPYIPSQTLRELPIYGREPTLALNGGRDGLVVLRRLLGIATEWLAPGGMILLEIEASQGMSAVSMAYDAFDRAEIHLHKDLAGLDRLVEIRL